MPENNPRIPFRLSTDHPDLKPMEGKPFMIHVVVNVEVWPFDKQMPRGLIQHPHGKVPVPDIANFSWAEYGLRVGMPRLAKIFRERGIPVSNFMNAAIPEYYPACADLILEAGWKLTGHGLFQRSLLYEDDERAVIEEAMERYEAWCGERPRGWLGAGFGESMQTPDLLKAHGIDYLHDWMIDEVPVWMRTEHGPMLAVPYALDLNDVTVFALEKHTADEYVRRFRDTIEWYASQEAGQPRVITLGLHPHIVAPPYRVGALCEVLDFLLARDDTVFTTGAEIADWYKDQVSGKEIRLAS